LGCLDDKKKSEFEKMGNLEKGVGEKEETTDDVIKEIESFDATKPEKPEEEPSAGTRKVPFSRVIYIERDDFREFRPPSTSAWRRDSMSLTTRFRRSWGSRDQAEPQARQPAGHR
jgi:hypothetical protein